MSLIPCVAALPITPKDTPTVAHYITPLGAEFLASYLGFRTAIAVNLVGMKTSHREVPELLGRFEADVARLGLRPHLLWRDDTIGAQQLVQDAVEKLACQGRLTCRTAPVTRCPCGAVEVPAHVLESPRAPIKLAHHGPGATVICRLCSQTTHTEQVPSLYLELAWKSIDLDVLPSWAAAESRAILRSYAPDGWRISRIRPTGVQVDVLGQHFNIDVDFSWSFLPTSLQRSGLEVRALVVGHRNLAKGIVMAHVNGLLGEWKPERCLVLTMPTVLGSGGVRLVDGGPYTLDKLPADVSADGIRVWMSQAFGWRQKEYRLLLKDLPRCQRVADKATRLLRDRLARPARSPAEPAAEPEMFRRFLDEVDDRAIRRDMFAVRHSAWLETYAETPALDRVLSGRGTTEG